MEDNAPTAEPADTPQPRHSWRYPNPILTTPADGSATDLTIAEEFGLEAALAIRTRLTSVKGFGQLVRRSAERAPVGVDRLLEQSAYLTAEIQALERLLLQFLEAFQLHCGARRPKWHEVDLMPLIQTISSSVTPPFGPSGTSRVMIDGPASAPGIWDQRWLTDALSAVIANAVAYSPEGGLVDIQVRRTDGQAEVTVRDRGLGIQPEERFEIFRPFVRGSAATVHPHGWGLGLFVVAQVVAQHGGVIEVESVPGVGSAFTLRLPTMPPPQTNA